MVSDQKKVKIAKSIVIVLGILIVILLSVLIVLILGRKEAFVKHEHGSSKEGIVADSWKDILDLESGYKAVNEYWQNRIDRNHWEVVDFMYQPVKRLGFGMYGVFLTSKKHVDPHEVSEHRRYIRFLTMGRAGPVDILLDTQGGDWEKLTFFHIPQTALIVLSIYGPSGIKGALLDFHKEILPETTVVFEDF